MLRARFVVIALLATGLLTACGSSGSVSPTDTTSPEPTESETSEVIVDPTQDPIEAGVEIDFGGPPFGAGSEGEPMEGRKCTSLAFDDCWRMVNIDTTGTASLTDVTTWSAKLLGGPVRLVG